MKQLPSTDKIPDGIRGCLFVISAPSGAGKTTLCKRILCKFPFIQYSVSSTTRPPRKGEKDGVDYCFISEEEFKKGIGDNKWAEWAKVHGNYYGTSAAFIEERVKQNIPVLMDIDVKGALQIIGRYRDAVSIFIMPPSIGTLRDRLVKRGSETDEQISRRLSIAKEEMEKKNIYQHIIVNEDLENATLELLSIVKQSVALL